MKAHRGGVCLELQRGQEIIRTNRNLKYVIKEKGGVLIVPTKNRARKM